MSGPKHLWSGDWQSESSPPAAPPRRVVEPEPEPEPGPEPRWLWRQIAIAVCASLLVAGVAFTLTALLEGSSKRSPQTHRHAASPRGSSNGSGGSGLGTPLPSGNPYSPSANWLGMQIDSSPNGVFVDSMNTSGAADAAGLEPGDQIVAINNYNIDDSVLQIRSATSGLKIGAPVEITVMRNSVEVHSQLIPMMQRPTIHP